MAQALKTLPETLDAFVDEQVRSGAYQTRDAVIVDAVERLRAEIETDDAKLERLNLSLRDAASQLDRGEGVLVTDIEAHFDEIEAEALRR